MERRSPPGFIGAAFAILLLDVSARAAEMTQPVASDTEQAAVPAAAEPVANDAPDDRDVVESIDSDAPPAPSAPSAALAQTPEPVLPAPAPALADEPDRFELHGWARQSLEIGLWRAQQASDSDPTALPYDQLTARSQLFMRARYSHARWFEANVSGAVSYALFEESPTLATTAFNGLNGRSARGVLEPQLHELFVGFFTPRLDIRIGQQRVAWGNSDFMSPNDVMNARDLRDPFVSESELRSIPTFMLRADLDLGFATLQGIVSPVFTPDRYDVYGSNWAGIQPDAPVWARGLATIARRSLDPTLREQAQRLLSATRYPKSDFTEPVVGGRFSWSAGGVDLNYYYQYGFDGPLVRIDPTFAANLASIDFSHAGLVALEPWLEAIDAGQQPLRASYVRRHHVGMDLGIPLGRFALRMDAAYESKRVFFKRDLTGTVSPTIEGVLSAEYQTADKDKRALLEVIYLRIIDPSAPLLIYDRDTLGVGGDLRWPIWRTLGFETRALLGIQPSTATVQPELNLKFEPWVVSLGGLWLDGEEYSFGQHFHRNIEAYGKAKVLF